MTQQDDAFDRGMLAWVADQLHPPWWIEAAACRGESPDLFFLDKGKPSRKAKAICAECPVTAACLDFAIAQGLTAGVYGGLTPAERKALRRQAVAS